EIVARDGVQQIVAGRGVFLLRANVDFDAIGNELLDLKTIGADDVASGDEIDAMMTGARVRRQRDRERRDAAVAEREARAFAFVAAVEVFRDERHLRRWLQRAIAYDGDAFDDLAGAIDVTLAVQKCGVAVGGKLIAGNVERRDVDLGFVEVQKAVIAPLLHRDDERRLLADEFREAFQMADAAFIGAAGRERLTLRADERDRGAV